MSIARLRAVPLLIGVVLLVLPANTTAPVRASSPPTAPVNLRATAGDGEVELRWAPPVSDGGSQILDYRVQYQLAGTTRWEPWVDEVSTVRATAVRPASIAAANTSVYGLVTRPIGSAVQCVVARDGEPACWGDDDRGALGDGVRGAESSPVPVDVPDHLVSVTAGALHACGLTPLGAVRCWGTNRLGQLGDGSTAAREGPVEAMIAGAIGTEPIAHLDAGDHHTCAATTLAIACWGANEAGQLGLGDTVGRAAPSPVALGPLAGKTIAQLAAGSHHTCALAADGAVACWGGNEVGQVGDASVIDRPTPALITGGAIAGKTVVAIASGGRHSCALATDGSVACWGANESGQLGDGGTTGSLVPVAIESGALAGTAVLAIAAGARHTCAAAADSISCWGANRWGQLGDGGADDQRVPGSVMLGPLAGAPVTALDAGLDHSCAIAGAVVACWGNNRHGKLGNGSTTVTNAPVAVVGTAGASDVALGSHHTCLAGLAAPARCVGANDVGQLGTGTLLVRPLPAAVDLTMAGLSDQPVALLAAGAAHTCAVSSDGLAACWGVNQFGQLGAGDRVDRDTPAPVLRSAPPLAGRRVLDIDAAGGHTCAVTDEGRIACWGDNIWGQLGNGGPIHISTTPIEPAVAGTPLGAGTVERVAAGGAHTCATTAQAVVCWGRNADGQVGDGTAIDRPTPVLVAGVLGATGIHDVVAGERHSCALTDGGRVACWGANESGQLGDGSRTGRVAPTFVSAGALTGRSVALLVAGARHTCALATDGAVACWGANESGQLGDGTTVDRLVPTLVVRADLGGAVNALSAGSRHSCAATADRSLACWGDNLRGQLGNGSFATSLTPRLAVAEVGGTLRHGSAYRFRVAAVSAAGRGPWSVSVSAVVGAPIMFGSVAPFRLEDTRQGGVKVGSRDGSAGPLRFNVLGRGGVPESGVGAVSLNVTVAEGELPALGGGYVTVDGCAAFAPNASNLNFGAGQTTANAVITPVSPGGDVCVYLYGTAHVIIDVNGYLPAGSDFGSVAPFRLEDTRQGGVKVGSRDGSAGPLRFNVLGRGGVPESGVGAVSLNVTVAEGELPALGGGYVTVDGCAASRPNASNLNFGAGQTTANAVITPVSPGGDVCVYLYGTAHVIIDVNGYLPAGSDFGSVAPFRLEDTRQGGVKVGSRDGSAGPLRFNVLGRGGVPESGVGAVSLNVTVAEGELPALGGGYVTVDGCAASRPNASNLNFGAGQTTANAVITPVSPGGDVCVYLYGTAHVIIDVNGYLP